MNENDFFDKTVLDIIEKINLELCKACVKGIKQDKRYIVIKRQKNLGEILKQEDSEYKMELKTEYRFSNDLIGASIDDKIIDLQDKKDTILQIAERLGVK